MTRDDGLRKIRTGLVLLALFFYLNALFVYLNAQSYVGRYDLWQDQVAQCERGSDTAEKSAVGWRTEEAAARRDGHPRDAYEYAVTAKSLEDRAALKCREKFRKPTPFRVIR